MSNGSSISGWTVYDTAVSNSRNAAIVLDGSLANFTMNGGEITGNYNIGANSSAGSAVQIHNGAVFTMNDGCISGNGNPEDNSQYGSGVYVNGSGSHFIMNGGTVSDNFGKSGAGIYVNGTASGNAILEIYGGSIERNIIANSNQNAGAGIYANYVDVKMLGTQDNPINISQNGVTKFGEWFMPYQVNGGGIYAKNSVLSLNNVKVEHNTATGNNGQGGAGIYLEDSNMYFSNGSISYNQIGDDGHNVWGGGLRIEDNGEVTLDNVVLEGNLTAPNTTRRYNVAPGGAIMMNGTGVLTLNDCIVKGNKAGHTGGGIYANQGEVNLRGNTVFVDNKCNNNRLEWIEQLGEAICITPLATVNVFDNVTIDKNNTVGLEGNSNSNAVLTIAGNYSGITKDSPVSIESNNMIVENNPDIKGTPLVLFLDEAGGSEAAKLAHEEKRFIVSDYMPDFLHIGQSEIDTNILTYVNNRAPIINASDTTLSVGDVFEPFKNVSAFDEEDGDLTKFIEILKIEVNTAQVGTYEVIYKVVDSDGLLTTKTIKVTVIADSMENKHESVDNGGSWDDGGPFSTDECGNVFDRWGNIIWKSDSCQIAQVDGYYFVNTQDK